MRYFDDVFAVFEHTNEHFEQRLLDALIGNDDAPEWGVVERQQKIHQRAYFVLLFSQLETEVNRLCGELIRRMQALPDSEIRRAWDILDAGNDQDRSFMNRVAFLTNKNGKVYRRVKELYLTRSKIVHGDLLAEPPELTRVATEMQDIASQLQERP